jgi:hypothetical protein
MVTITSESLALFRVERRSAHRINYCVVHLAKVRKSFKEAHNKTASILEKNLILL